MVLQLRGVHLVFGVIGRVLIEVGKKDGLRIRGLDVFSRAAIAMTAGADFVVKGTVDFVLLCAKDGGEVVGHDEGLTAGILVGRFDATSMPNLRDQITVCNMKTED